MTTSLTLFILLLGRPASGDPFGTDTTSTGARADSATHTYCLGSSLNDASYLYFVDQMNYLGSATQMTADGPHACSTTTDVIAQSTYLDPGTLGDTTCFDYRDYGAHICARSRVRIDESQIGQAYYATATLRQTICHEIGHSVGLQHYRIDGIPAPYGESDCMRSGDSPSTTSTWHQYGDHHRWHIDNAY